MNKKILFVSIFSLLIVQAFAQNVSPYQYSIQKKIICNNGAVVSAHPLASKVGVSDFKKGGNAVDAAIATQLALAVVYPNAGNIGGGGFMVARLKGKILQSIIVKKLRKCKPGYVSRFSGKRQLAN